MPQKIARRPGASTSGTADTAWWCSAAAGSGPRAKVLDYSIKLDRRYRVAADGGDAQQLPRDFAPEHHVLAGLARCTLTSLAYHAKRVGIGVATSSAGATGRVTKRRVDG